jgi:hypothetical protein
MKRRKYMPRLARKENVSVEVTLWNGLKTARIKPKMREAKIQGTFIFSITRPVSMVNMNAIARKKNMKKTIYPPDNI